MLRTLFIRRKVESSGYMVSEDSILLIPSYVEKVLEWPLLRSGKELSVYLWVANYYRDYLPDLVKLTAGLNRVKTKGVIDWSDNMINDFQKVQKLFSGAQCRASPDFSGNALPFIHSPMSS